MRILAIRGRNLASLEGDFAVELDAEPLAHAGLFVITGPTGSGKSTILDALCLALFDRVPRLPSERRATEVGRAQSSPEERIKSNDVRAILRHGAGEGHAEVDFLANDGRRYRARWSLHRARNRSTGRLQQQDMQLEDLASGELLGSNKTEVLAEISARIGLSFEQFRRSVLLAQGDFAAFLRAAPKERSELLERITGTEIYSRISMAAHQREREQRQALDLLEAQLGGMVVLETAERAELEARNHGEKQALAQTQLEVSTAHRDLDWHHRLSQLLRDEKQAAEAHAASERLWTDAQELRLELEAVQAALPARPYLVAFDRGRARLEAARADVELIAGRAAKAVQAATTAEASAERAEETMQAAMAERQNRRADVDEARRLEAAVQTAKAALDRTVTEVDTMASGLEARQKAHDELVRHGAALDEGHRTATTWLAEHDHLEALGERWERWQALFENLIAHHCELEGAAIRHLELVGRQDEAELLLHAAKEAEEAAQAVRQEEVHRLRAKLVAGEPCPVCGATEHPGTRPPATSGDDVNEFPSPTGASAGPGLSAQSLDDLQEHHTDLVAQVHASAATRERAQTGVDAALHALSEPLEKIPDWREQVQDDPLALSERCARWASDWVDQRQQRDRAGAEIDRHAGLEATSAASLATAETGVDSAREKMGTDGSVVTSLGEELLALSGGRSADVLADELEQAEITARDSLNRARDGLAQARQLTATTEQQVASARSVVHDLEAEVERTQSELDSAMASLAIDGEELRRLLAHEPSWLDSERRRLEDLEQRLREETIRLSERRAALTEHREARPTTATAEKAEAAVETAEERRDQALAALSASASRLKQDDDAVTQKKALDQDVEAATNQWQTWAALKDVIGSADGSKLRRFAQSLTLEALLGHANQHLRELARRFVLQRVPDSDLELQVVDRDMADEVRSVFSLSGGESFLVSLALALGLASLNSRRTRVESLFIDEGFGSLDADSLETAVASLDALQSLGRQVGVISHVATLVERIGIRVEVRAGGGGRSTVAIGDAATH